MLAVPREAKLVIAIGLLEAFAANFSMMASFIWLTTRFLPQTQWDPATASTLFLAVTGLSIFLLMKQVGSLVDRFKPQGLFLSVQAANLIMLPLMALTIALADPQRPWLTLAALFVLDLLISARASTYNSAVDVLIAHVVPKEHQSDYYSLDFRIGLIAVFLAPAAASYAVQQSVYLGLGIAAAITGLSLALLLTPPYRGLEALSYGRRVSWTPRLAWREPLTALRRVVALLRITRRRSPDPATAPAPPAKPRRGTQRTGLRSLRYVKHIGIILTLMTTEALGNRARESFDIYFVTDTLGRTAGDFGLLAVALSVGLTIGSFAAGWTRRRIRWRLWPSACYMGFGLCFAAKGLAPTWELVLLTTAGEGLCLGLMSGVFQAAKVQFTPRALLGSTSAALGAVFQGVSTAGLALWAAYAWVGSRLGEEFMGETGYRTAFVVGGGRIALAGALSPRFYAAAPWRKEA